MDLLQLLRNLAGAYPAIVQFLEVAAYAAGAWMVVMAMLHLNRSHGELRPANINNNAWIWQLSIAVLLFSLPSFIDTTASQIFGSAPQNPMAYANSSFDASGPLLAPLAGLLQIFGMAFAIRGLLVLRAYGVHGMSGGNTFGKGFVQIVAGVLLVNLDPFLMTIESITGLKVGAGLIY